MSPASRSRPARSTTQSRPCYDESIRRSPNQIREFRDHVRELRRHKTLLLSTHILQEVDAVADRALLVHNGRLVFDGSPAELAETGSLEERFYRYTHDTTAARDAGAESRRRQANARGDARP